MDRDAHPPLLVDLAVGMVPGPWPNATHLAQRGSGGRRRTASGARRRGQPLSLLVAGRGPEDRRAPWPSPEHAGLAAGASLSLVVDEGLAPALGLSARNRDCPPGTHVRGFVAHLIWGAAAALAAEAVYHLTAPSRRRGPNGAPGS